MTRQIVLALFFLFVCENALTACATNMAGRTKEFGVTIHQDCGIRSEIEVFKLDQKSKNSTTPYQRGFLDTECQFIAGEAVMGCRKNGKTILSGARYKLTYDDAPNCPGASFGHRYTCIKGCTRFVPKYLSIDPYEC